MTYNITIDSEHTNYQLLVELVQVARTDYTLWLFRSLPQC